MVGKKDHDDDQEHDMADCDCAHSRCTCLERWDGHCDDGDGRRVENMWLMTKIGTSCLVFVAKHVTVIVTNTIILLLMLMVLYNHLRSASSLRLHSICARMLLSHLTTSPFFCSCLYLLESQNITVLSRYCRFCACLSQLWTTTPILSSFCWNLWSFHYHIVCSAFSSTLQCWCVHRSLADFAVLMRACIAAKIDAIRVWMYAVIILIQEICTDA